MFKILFSPIRLVTAGAILWGSWKVGSYVGDVALGKKDPPWKKITDFLEAHEPSEPVLKPESEPISEPE